MLKPEEESSGILEILNGVVSIYNLDWRGGIGYGRGRLIETVQGYGKRKESIRLTADVLARSRLDRCK